MRARRAQLASRRRGAGRAGGPSTRLAGAAGAAAQSEHRSEVIHASCRECDREDGRPRRSHASALGAVPTPGRRLGARNGRRNDFSEIFCETTLRIGPSASCGKNPHEKKNRYLDRYVLRRDGRGASERASRPESPARDDDGIFFLRAVFFSVASIVQSRSKRPKKSRAQGSDARRLGAVPTPRGRPRPTDASEHVTVDVTIFEKIFCEDDFAHRTVDIMWKKFAREKNRYLDRYVLRRDVTVGASERAPERPARVPRRRTEYFFFRNFFSPSLRLCKVGPSVRKRPAAQGSDARRLGAVPTGLGAARPTPRST